MGDLIPDGEIERLQRKIKEESAKNPGTPSPELLNLNNQLNHIRKQQNHE